MKRGLVLLDANEVAPEEYHRRIATVQAALRGQGWSAALIYGDVWRSGDITYLSNLCLYWNEGILAIPAEGPVAFLTKLSPRVHPWMRRTAVVEDLRSGPNLADLVRRWLAPDAIGPVGAVDADFWPAQLWEDVQEAVAPRTVEDAGGLVRRMREAPSASEVALLRQSAAIAHEAVAQALGPGLTAPERAGRAEAAARAAGVEDVYVFCRPVAPGLEAVEVVAEFRGYWTTAARMVGARPPWWPTLSSAWHRAVARLTAGVRPRALAEAVAADGPDGMRVRADLIHHVDLETGGDYRRLGDRDRPVTAGSVVALAVSAVLPDGGRAVLADTFAVEVGGAVPLATRLPAATDI
ncbi:MAG: hypothetical protein K6U14_08350 [Firmicutes bacterium]|nr:hypothetical protein [Alicyclobacillaceae bacterium]MCL6497619.1 hypothetical protein [Bacillota bacterium]